MSGLLNSLIKIKSLSSGKNDVFILKFILSIDPYACWKE